jgi:hypothetical protein
MNADLSFLPVFLLIGTPAIVLAGGPYAWRGIVILAAIGGLAYAPAIAGVVIITWLLRGLVWDFLIAFAAGLGARLAGTFNSAERAERMRERWENRRNRKG